jgi:hypothetical protein
VIAEQGREEGRSHFQIPSSCGCTSKTKEDLRTPFVGIRTPNRHKSRQLVFVTTTTYASITPFMLFSCALLRVPRRSLHSNTLDQHVDVVDPQAIELLVRSLHVQQQASKTRKVLPNKLLAYELSISYDSTYTLSPPSPSSNR